MNDNDSAKALEHILEQFLAAEINPDWKCPQGTYNYHTYELLRDLLILHARGTDIYKTRREDLTFLARQGLTGNIETIHMAIEQHALECPECAAVYARSQQRTAFEALLYQWGDERRKEKKKLN